MTQAVCKNGGGRPGIFYDVSVYLGRRGGEGSLIERMHFAHVFFSNLEWYVYYFANVRNSSAWARNCKIRPQARSLDGGPLSKKYNC